MITLENTVSKRGGFTLKANFALGEGRLCAVLGPSGAGKSSLLNVIAGFDDLVSGRVLIDGEDVSRASPARRPISMVFQDHNLFPHLSVWDNVALGAAASLRLTEEDKSRVDEALARVGLASLTARKPFRLSGGERQRVALARVLVRRSKVLLLDEPFAALDPGLRAEMLQEVVDLTREQKLTTLLVTHQPEEIRAAVDDMLFVAAGQVSGPMAPAAFFANGSPAIAAYLGLTARG
ncbi:MAG: ATP-binding cassette domain-containing protein [Alphaproteobacteria bacterium]|nr:ATP-binding cassette domain-containing protein [Alphaproteobacteria bacterium]